MWELLVVERFYFKRITYENKHKYTCGTCRCIYIYLDIQMYCIQADS